MRKAAVQSRTGLSVQLRRTRPAGCQHVLEFLCAFVNKNAWKRSQVSLCCQGNTMPHTYTMWRSVVKVDNRRLAEQSPQNQGVTASTRVFIKADDCIRAHTSPCTHAANNPASYSHSAQGGVILTVADGLGCVLPCVSCVTLQSPGGLSPDRLWHPRLGSAPTNASSRNSAEPGGWGSRINLESLPGSKSSNSSSWEIYCTSENSVNTENPNSQHQQNSTMRKEKMGNSISPW